MRRKKGTEQDAPAAGARITPEQVQQVEFRLAFRGYNERDVDAFLDRVTEDLSAYVSDNERLGGGGTAAGANGSTEAEQTLARARAEADEILRRAREDAANIRAAAAPSSAGSGDARAAVAPFLNTEREFLQSLGSLVQSHAEEIKQLVVALRARTEVAPEERNDSEPNLRTQAERPASPSVVREEPGPAETPSAVEAAPISEIRARLEAAGESPEIAEEADESTLANGSEDTPIVVDGGTEPVYTTEGSPAGEGQERSLRELFWGED